MAAFSPDGTRLASICLDGPKLSWHTATGKRLQTLEGGKILCTKEELWVQGPCDLGSAEGRVAVDTACCRLSRKYFCPGGYNKCDNQRCCVTHAACIANLPCMHLRYS